MADTDPGKEFVACSSEPGEACSRRPTFSPATARSHKISSRTHSYEPGATGPGSRPSKTSRRGSVGCSTTSL